MISLWSRPPKQQQLYSSVQQGESDEAMLEKVSLASKGSKHYSHVLLVLLLLVNTVVLWFSVQSYRQAPSREDSYCRHEKLVKSPVPDFPHEIKSFHTHPVYMDRPSKESDAAWELLGGPPRDHRGFISVENPEARKLDDGTGSRKDMYGVSMLHQLHCLGGIRKMLWGVLQGTLSAQELLDGYPQNTTDPTFEATTHGLWHVSHCFDYLRQGIQCAGDMSLEWPIEVNGDNLVVGWNNPHECRSWDAAWQYIEAHS